MIRNFYKIGKLQISSVLIIALLAMSAGVYFSLSDTKAAALTSVRDILSSSQPSATSTHQITFVHTTGIAQANGDKTITIEFDTSGTAFDLSNVTSTDIDFAVGDSSNCDTASYTDYDVAVATSSGAWGIGINLTTDVITFIYPSNSTTTITANRCVKIEIGGNATFRTTGANNITNPAKSAGVGTSDVYTMAIAGTSGDSGNTLVAIIEGVTVSATVAESLTFTITGVTSGNCVQGKGGNGYTATSTTSSTVPFGQLTADTFTQGCQDILVKTNAPSGFNLTTRTSSSLINANNNSIPDTDCDSEDCTTAVATTWTTATDSGFGYSCDPGGTTDACNSTFSTSTVFRPFSSSTAVSVASTTSATAVAGDTQRILYRVAVDSAQQAGSYNTVVTWVASPSF
ncbi:MAG: hypothetical protein HYT12_04300 [Candidatus Liptonbacteria bacterium]|nr:hypothetical protein [Candidatus Liptonbacteria bacterium]